MSPSLYSTTSIDLVCGYPAIVRQSPFRLFSAARVLSDPEDHEFSRLDRRYTDDANKASVIDIILTHCVSSQGKHSRYSRWEPETLYSTTRGGVRHRETESR